VPLFWQLPRPLQAFGHGMPVGTATVVCDVNGADDTVMPATVVYCVKTSTTFTDPSPSSDVTDVLNVYDERYHDGSGRLTTSTYRLLSEVVS